MSCTPSSTRSPRTVSTPREVLAALADPVLLALLSASEDDEPLTEEDLQAIAEGEEDQRHGRTITLDEYITHHKGQR